MALAQAVGRTLRGFQPPFKIYIIIMVNYLYLFYVSSKKKKNSVVAEKGIVILRNPHKETVQSLDRQLKLEETNKVRIQPKPDSKQEAQY